MNGGHPRFIPVGALAALALALAAATIAAARPAAGPDAAQIRFSSLEVDIWPEYDRRGAVLVILKGEVAPDLALPATVGLRLPAAAEPTAVAFATGNDAALFNLQHERVTSGEGVTLRFTTAHRRVHVEFYQPLLSQASERRFRYEWAGDAEVDRFVVRLQEPAGASALTVKPELEPAGNGTDGLQYRQLGLGSFNAGRRVPVEIRYLKEDPRTSVEILGLDRAAVSATPSPAAAAPAQPSITPAWLIAAVMGGIGLAAVAIVLSWLRFNARRTAQPTANPRRDRKRPCKRCGHPLEIAARFCPQCGASAGR